MVQAVGLQYAALISFLTMATNIELPNMAQAVELQYGGRISFLAGNAEAAAAVFVSLTAAVVSLPNRCLPR